jgi:hypothetical protein
MENNECGKHRRQRIADGRVFKPPLASQYLESPGFPGVLKKFETPRKMTGQILSLRMPVPAR